MAVAVGFAGQISIGIVSVSLDQSRRERRLCESAQRVISKRGFVRGSVGDLREIVFAVVGVAGHLGVGIGDRDKTVGVVVRVCGDLAVGVRYRGAATAIVVRELHGSCRRS